MNLSRDNFRTMIFSDFRCEQETYEGLRLAFVKKRHPMPLFTTGLMKVNQVAPIFQILCVNEDLQLRRLKINISAVHS